MNDQILWFATRGAGVVSLLLFSAVTCLGILTVMRWQSASWPRFLTVELHRNLALLSVVFLVVHIVTAILDPFVTIGWLAVAVPFTSDYRPLWVGLGAISVDLLIAILVTSLLRARVGQRAWRAVHWLAYGAWPLAVAHSIGTGSDASALWMRAIDIACVLVVGGAVAWRVAAGRSNRSRLADVVVGGGRGPASRGPSGSGAGGAGPRPGGPDVTALTTPPISRLLAGPPLRAGTESGHDHQARLGPLPAGAAARYVIPTLEASGLLGRGGAGFPVGRKWRTVAERSAGGTVVLVNGAEGEPLSAKDRALMTLRPHLVIDGAELAAEAVGAEEVILYIGTAHVTARASIAAALAQRARHLTVPMQVVAAPDRYIAGEELAAVHFVNDADARPTNTPPRPFESGIGGRPTLVQNVESIAYAALIARWGDDWYRSTGRATTPGTGLVTVSGVPRPGVREIELGTTVGEVALMSGAERGSAPAVLVGGYFGAWATSAEAWDLALDPAGLRAAGRAFGCGIVSFLGPDVCGVSATAGIMSYMAGESAAQCGPCVFGLRAIADATARIAARTGGQDDLARIERWTGQLAGRGACRHPDGAVGLLASALRVFGDEFVRHAAGASCSVADRRGAAA